MNFSLPQKLLVTVIPSASKSDRRPSDWETQGQWDKISLLCYPSLGDPAFKFQRLVWSEAAYHFLTALSFQNSALSCSCRQYGNHRSIPSNAKVVSFWEIRTPWKWGLWKSSEGWCLFHRGQLVPVHHSEGQEIQQELGLGIKKRPASQCFSFIQPQSCMLLKGQWSLHPQRPRRPEISLPRHSLAERPREGQSGFKRTSLSPRLEKYLADKSPGQFCFWRHGSGLKKMSAQKSRRDMGAKKGMFWLPMCLFPLWWREMFNSTTHSSPHREEAEPPGSTLEEK